MCHNSMEICLIKKVPINNVNGNSAWGGLNKIWHICTCIKDF